MFIARRLSIERVRFEFAQEGHEKQVDLEPISRPWQQFIPGRAKLLLSPD
jgi:hypothetical protein